MNPKTQVDLPISLHDDAALLFQFFQDPWEILLDCGLYLLVLVLLTAPLLLLLLLLRARVSTLLLLTSVVLLLWLLVLLVLLSMVLAAMLSSLWPIAMIKRRHMRWSTLQVDEYSASVLFGRILQAKFATYFLHFRFELLDVIDRVIPLPHDSAELEHMQSSN